VQERLGVEVNSFSSFDAKGKAEAPTSLPNTSACRSSDGARATRLSSSGEHSLFGAGAMRADVAGGGKDHDIHRGQLKRGSISRADFAMSAIMMRGSKNIVKRLARANSFDVVGGVSDAEVELLSPIPPGDRAFLVTTWLVRLMTNRLAEGGLAIPPPLLSRTYQVLSDGTAAAMQARKISFVAFPFPLRQLLAVLLGIFVILAPYCIAAFVNSVALCGVLCFFVTLGYVALNETASELENPFGLGANHLRLVAYQAQFNSKMARLLNQTIPALGYRPPEKLLPASMRQPGEEGLDQGGGGVDIGGATDATGTSSPSPPVRQRVQPTE